MKILLSNDDGVHAEGIKVLYEELSKFADVTVVAPDRNCSGCVTVKDSYTQELAREIAAALIFKTGCYPHLIINKLHRKKLDANREIIEATDSNSATEVYWHNYMNFIDSAKRSISSKYQKGVFLDIHGHGHAIQRIELG